MSRALAILVVGVALVPRAAQAWVGYSYSNTLFNYVTGAVAIGRGQTRTAAVQSAHDGCIALGGHQCAYDTVNSCPPGPPGKGWTALASNHHHIHRWKELYRQRQAYVQPGNAVLSCHNATRKEAEDDAFHRCNNAAAHYFRCRIVDVAYDACPSGMVPGGTHPDGCRCEGNRVRKGYSCRCPPQLPNWDAQRKTCSACPGGQTFNGARCACSPGAPPWNGSACACPASVPFWNTVTRACEACADGTAWDGQRCVVDKSKKKKDAENTFLCITRLCCIPYRPVSTYLCSCPLRSSFKPGAHVMYGQCVCDAGHAWDHAKKECVAAPCPAGMQRNPVSAGVPCICGKGTVRDSTGKQWCVREPCTWGRVRSGDACVCPAAKPRWQEKTQVCEACGKGEAWNGKECACPKRTPLWSEEKKRCEACPAGQAWSGNACECPKERPSWSAERRRCEACPSKQVWSGSACQCPKSAPRWNETAKRCEACPGGQVWSAGACQCPSTTPTWNEKARRCEKPACGPGRQEVGGKCVGFCVSEHTSSCSTVIPQGYCCCADQPHLIGTCYCNQITIKTTLAEAELALQQCCQRYRGRYQSKHESFPVCP